jgi:hypothetical protein
VYTRAEIKSSLASLDFSLSLALALSFFKNVLLQLVLEMRVFEQKVRFTSLTPPSNASVFVSAHRVVEVDVRALLEFFVGDFRFLSPGEPGAVLFVESPVGAFQLSSG